MFGFLNPICRSEKYRMLYCDSCSHMRANYGRGSTPFLSYESVLVHAMAFDAGLICEEDTVVPCRGLPIPKRPKSTTETHRRIGEFSAALTHLLVKTKLEDDILDDGSRLARFTIWFYGKKLARSVRYFSEIDPESARIMQSFFDKHREMELSGKAKSLTEYAKPTADAFGYVFGLLGVAIDDRERRPVYASLGRHVGEAIIYADCSYDWIRDQKKGLYNPVQTFEESAIAIASSQAALRKGRDIALDFFGKDSATEMILIGVHDRLYRQAELNKKYQPYLVPLRECSSGEKVEQKKNGIIMASNAACPSLALFAQGGGDGCCALICCCCCCGLLAPFADKFCAGFANACHNVGQGCGSSCMKCD